jgi:starch synthase
MEILFVTTEPAPWDASGSEPRTLAALPKALRSLDHRVTVVSPLYAQVDPAALQLARRLLKLEFEVGGEAVACELYDGRTSAGVELLFIGHAELFGEVRALSEGAPEAVARRAGAFARAVVGVVETREPRPALVHAHGWTGALAVARLGNALPSVLTVHDPGKRGTSPSALGAVLGIPDDLLGVEGVTEGDQVHPLHAGLRRARRVTVPSPSRAREMATPGGAGHAALYAELGERFVGLTHGVDAALYNPATDALLPARFDPMDLTGKQRSKAALQKDAGLPVRADVCLVGAVHEEVDTTALELLTAAAPGIVRNDVQLVVVTGGEARPHAAGLRDLAERYPERVAVHEAGERQQVHRALGGSDVLAVASGGEAAVHFAMGAQRYGTLPVAHRGGLAADVIVDCDARLETGSGFLFDEPTGSSLADAVGRAVAGHTLTDAFTALCRRVMRIDNSWDRSARLYDRQYQLATEDGE